MAKNFITRRPRKLKPVTDRFWPKVDKSAGPDGCWLWTACKVNGDYGILRVDGKNVGAHRISYELTFGSGSLTPDMDVCHRCDNPPCVNPSHLFAGTTKDNIQDAIAKGRFASQHGEKNPNARLTRQQVDQIISLSNLGQTQTSIAKKFGINQTHVSRIIAGTAWKD